MDTDGLDGDDRRLGMDRPITRRDLLEGALRAGAAALGGGTLAGCTSFGAPGPVDATSAYPPTATGMRGSHPGSFESAHALRDGEHWNEAEDSGETYDLVVVGAGISGLAAAYFFCARAGAGARVLLLDNHDDFGGHAKRNEFHVGGGIQLLNGGTLEIDSPQPYGPVADGLLRELGVDVDALVAAVEHPEFYRSLGMGGGVFFDRETFGADRLVASRGDASWARRLDGAPLSAKARADLLEIEEGHVDYLPGLASSEKKLKLASISYRDFLRDVVGVDPAVLAFCDARTKGWWGVGIDAVSALDCWGIDIKGFQGMNLAPGAISRMGFTPAGYAATGGSYRLHFPDGNATIARLLVRRLIPGSAPGATVDDIVTARFDYGRLDRAGTTVRLRLASTVVRVRHLGAPDGDAGAGVEVTYVRDGRALRVAARQVVLACYNMMIPYLCPELPGPQKAALHQLVKTPLVYTSVAIQNWRAFHELGVARVYSPGCYHTDVFLNPTTTIGSYRSPTSPEQPTLVHMVRTPCRAGLTEHEQNRAGREELLITPFSTFERRIRDQLSRMLGPGGFDSARDIAAITVNRWPHGYAPEYNPLFEADLPLEQQPHVIGRARFGRIAIANSDSGGGAYTSVAIDQAWRAIGELLSGASAG
jgi:spermidine dehydrogenase